MPPVAEAGAGPASEPGGTLPNREEQQTEFQPILLKPAGSPNASFGSYSVLHVSGVRI